MNMLSCENTLGIAFATVFMHIGNVYTKTYLEWFHVKYLPRIFIADYMLTYSDSEYRM